MPGGCRVLPGSEYAFADVNGVVVQQRNVRILALENALVVLPDHRLFAVDRPLDRHLAVGAVGQAAGVGQRLQQRRILRAPERYAARLHHFAEDVDVQRCVDRYVHHVVREEGDVDVRIAVDQQVFEIDGDLFGQSVRSGAENVQRPAIAGGQAAGLRDGLHQRDASRSADPAGMDHRADDRDRLVARFDHLDRYVGRGEVLPLQKRLDAAFRLWGRQSGHVDFADQAEGDLAVVSDDRTGVEGGILKDADLQNVAR